MRKIEVVQQLYGEALDDLKAAESKLARAFRRWNECRMRARRLELELDRFHAKLDTQGFVIEGESNGTDVNPAAGVDPNGSASADRGPGTPYERDTAEAEEAEAEWIAANRDSPLGRS